jgi:putative hydrolase of HD superfamily
MKKNKSNKLDSVLEFICESGMLKRVQRSGWSVLGIKNPESVAEHSFRCAVIGYCMAHAEKADPYRVILMTLFNDMQEARITDLHKMAQYYIKSEGAEDKAFKDQIEYLPITEKRELSESRSEYRKQDTKESIIARDADILECLIQAKEYMGHGYAEAAKFMKKAPGFLRTKSAKKLWDLAVKTDVNEWWIELSRFKR